MQRKKNLNQTISDEIIFNKIVEEKESIGYYNLPFQDTSLLKEYARGITQNNVVVIGIGGSALGTNAIYKYLECSKKISKKLFSLETTDPLDIIIKLDDINLKDAFFVVISKSGTTIETIALFKYIHSLVRCDSTNTVVVTENDSSLKAYADANSIKSFEIPKNVGGRFSVFSAVGLLPLAMVGVDIDMLLSGAKDVHDAFFIQKSEPMQRLLKKAQFLSEYKENHNINVVFSYSSRLEGFNKWYIQLWGESLGKIDENGMHQGLTPIGIIGPVDQHSFLQLIVQGKRDKTVTVIKVKDFDCDIEIPPVKLEGLEDLDYLNNLKFSTLVNYQADATIESIHALEDVPCDVIMIEGIDEKSIASLMYEYELLTSLVGKMIHIDTYNQPGVENGKVILKKKLYEAQK